MGKHMHSSMHSTSKGPSAGTQAQTFSNPSQGFPADFPGANYGEGDPSAQTELVTQLHALQERVAQLEGDAVDRKRALDRMVQQTSELEMRLQAKSDDSHAVHHELEALARGTSRSLKKTSRVVEQLAHELEMKSGEMSIEQIRQILSLIRAGSQQTNELAQRLAMFADIPRREIEKVPVRMAPLLVDISREHELELTQRKVDLKFDLHLPEVMAEPVLLRVLLNDLISNSLKFTRNVKDAVIEIGVSNSDGDQTWYVRDNGVGFPMQQGYKLFSPFQRLHGDEYDGFGVGLTIAQRIVHRHGGAIRMESQEGVGTTVYFALSGGQEFPTRPRPRKST